MYILKLRLNLKSTSINTKKICTESKHSAAIDTQLRVQNLGALTIKFNELYSK
jgi:hypothetical protein